MAVKTDGRAVLLGIGWVALLSACSDTSSDPCQVELLRHLKAPATAKVTMVFDHQGLVVVDRREGDAGVDNKGLAVVDRRRSGGLVAIPGREAGGWVDSQNSFGALLRTGWVCEEPVDRTRPARIAFVEVPEDSDHRARHDVQYLLTHDTAVQWLP